MCLKRRQGLSHVGSWTGWWPLVRRIEKQSDRATCEPEPVGGAGTMQRSGTAYTSRISQDTHDTLEPTGTERTEDWRSEESPLPES
jgi:hypothetical protein